MKYLNFVYLTLLLAAVGCQMSGHYEQGVPFRADVRQTEEVQRATETPRGFWAKTRGLFRLFLPETERGPAPSAFAHSTPPHPVTQPFAPASQTGLFDPNAAFYASGTGMSTVRPSQMMFDFRFLEREPVEENAPEPEKEKTANLKFLQARSGDSEAFRRLLKEFEETPEDEWQVDREELATRLANFRSAVRAEKNQHFETQYLFNLRENVLPESRRLAARRSMSNKKTASRKPTQRTDPLDEEIDERAEYRTEETEEDDLPPEPMSIRKTERNTAKTLARAPLPVPVKESKTPRNDAEVVQAAYRTSGGSSNNITSAAHVESARVEEKTSVSAPPPPPPAPLAPPATDDWESQTRLAVEQLRRKIEQTSGHRTLTNEARLRLLELALGNRSEAVRPLTTADKTFNEFWGSQMLGFSTLLDEVATPELPSRIVAAAFRFDEASSSINRLCPMKLQNVQFVKDWATFGVFLPRNEDCRAGENVGLYMELENPTVRHSAQGHNVRMSISYEIRDNAARIVHQADKIHVEETTPSQKRDYCIHLWIRLPKSLAHGQYQLRVNVTDMNSDSMQYAEEQIPIKILPASPAPE